jgi:hypothetical protein
MLAVFAHSALLLLLLHSESDALLITVRNPQLPLLPMPPLPMQKTPRPKWGPLSESTLGPPIHV